jgi:hypothetical protein
MVPFDANQRRSTTRFLAKNTPWLSPGFGPVACCVPAAPVALAHGSESVNSNERFVYHNLCKTFSPMRPPAGIPVAKNSSMKPFGFFNPNPASSDCRSGGKVHASKSPQNLPIPAGEQVSRLRNKPSQPTVLSASSTAVIRRIARSMLGRDVSVRTGTGETIHGIATSVISEEGEPRVVVRNAAFALTQILTVSPAGLSGT